MTIPSLKKNTQSRETVAQVKKAYSTFSNAVASAEAAEGPIQFWNWGTPGDGNSAVLVFEKLAPYLNIDKNCGTEKGCWGNVRHTRYDGGDYDIDGATNRAKARLADGSFIYLYVQSANCSTNNGNNSALQHICADIDIDINGSKGPNRVGVDVFYFWITREGVIPFGTKDDTAYPLSGCYTFGHACTAWVVANQNMDYMDRTVTWD